MGEGRSLSLNSLMFVTDFHWKNIHTTHTYIGYYTCACSQTMTEKREYRTPGRREIVLGESIHTPSIEIKWFPTNCLYNSIYITSNLIICAWSTSIGASLNDECTFFCECFSSFIVVFFVCFLWWFNLLDFLLRCNHLPEYDDILVCSQR